MITEDILSYLRKKAYTVFNVKDFKDIPTELRREVGAVLGSLNHEDLAELVALLQQDPTAPPYLDEEVEWYLNRSPKASSEHHRNESITQLIGWYNDKKSKKVSYASKELMARFSTQSYSIQKSILKSFLKSSNKKELEWCGRYLREHWDSSFKDAILTKWKETRIPLLASVIIQHLPEDVILKYQEDLSHDAGYAFVCSRIGNVKGFFMDESRLSATDWFYVMAKLGREDAIHKMSGRLKDCLLSLEPIDILLSHDLSLFSVHALGRVIWAMKKLHHTDGILFLINTWNRAVEYSQFEEEDDRHYAILFSLHRQAQNLEEEGDAYREAKYAWEHPYKGEMGNGPTDSGDYSAFIEDLAF